MPITPKTLPPVTKPKENTTQEEQLIDMSDFDPVAARQAHRLQIATIYGDEALCAIDGVEFPSKQHEVS